jgi:hypothetical protein
MICPENSEQRFNRYTKAKERLDLWLPLYQQAYELTIPQRSEFYEMTDRLGPNVRIDNVYDATAVEAVPQFANNIQSILFPPFRRWASLTAGEEIPEAEKDQANKDLQEITETFFNYLNKSNFTLALNEALQDLAVGTGFLLVQEGKDRNNPIHFQAIPIANMVAEEGEHGNLENFWRHIEVPVKLIERLWPKATLTNGLQSLKNNNPEQLVQLIEGTIYYPDNPKGKEYYYYVSEQATKMDLFAENRDCSPWVAFRYSVVAGELLGRGPVLTALPFIRVLNTMAEYELRNAKFRLANAYMVAGDGTINPYTVRIVPGAIIPVNSLQGNPPIAPIPVGGDVKFEQLSISDLRQLIKSILLADPLGPVDSQSQTATEVSLRQQNWVRQAAAAFGRLTVELTNPIIEKSIRILRRKGLIKKISIGPKVAIEYQSPLADIQNQDDIQRFQACASFLIQLLMQPLTVVLYRVEDLLSWAADKFGIDLELLRNSSEIQALLKNLQNNQGAQPGQPGQQPASANPQGAGLPPNDVMDTFGGLNGQPQ